MRMNSCWGHVGHGALQHFEQCLLHALTADVPGDGAVFALAGDLVDFVDVDDALLRPLHIVIRILDEPEQHVFHVLAHVARLGDAGGVADGEGHIQDLGQRLGKVRLAAARGAEHDDVALLQLHIVLFALVIDAFVVVVDGHAQGLFGAVLPYHVLIQHRLDFGGGLHVYGSAVVRSGGKGLVPDDLIAQGHALVADEYAGAGDEPLDHVRGPAAKGAAGFLVVLVVCRH